MACLQRQGSILKTRMMLKYFQNPIILIHFAKKIESYENKNISFGTAVSGIALLL